MTHITNDLLIVVLIVGVIALVVIAARAAERRNRRRTEQTIIVQTEVCRWCGHDITMVDQQWRDKDGRYCPASLDRQSEHEPVLLPGLK